MGKDLYVNRKKLGRGSAIMKILSTCTWRGHVVLFENFQHLFKQVFFETDFEMIAE